MHHRDKFLELKFKIISLRRFYSLFSLTTIIIGLKCKIFDDKVIFVGETFALFPFCYFLVKCNNEEKQRLIIFMLLLWVLLPFLDGHERVSFKPVSLLGKRRPEFWTFDGQIK